MGLLDPPPATPTVTMQIIEPGSKPGAIQQFSGGSTVPITGVASWSPGTAGYVMAVKAYLFQTPSSTVETELARVTAQMTSQSSVDTSGVDQGDYRWKAELQVPKARVGAAAVRALAFDMDGNEVARAEVPIALVP